MENIIKNPTTEPRVEKINKLIKSTLLIGIKVPANKITTSLGEGGKRFSIKAKPKTINNK
jgi:hypothetical protein